MPHDNKQPYNRITPASMDHLAHQIITHAKTMEQERPSSLFNIFQIRKKQYLSYALTMACLVLILAVSIARYDTVPSPQRTPIEIAHTDTYDSDWEEFLILEEEHLFAELY